MQTQIPAPIAGTSYRTPEQDVSTSPAALFDIVKFLQAEQHNYLLVRRRTLVTELNEVLRQLGENPKRCSHCGELLK